MYVCDCRDEFYLLLKKNEHDSYFYVSHLCVSNKIHADVEPIGDYDTYQHVERVQFDVFVRR